MDSTGEEIDTEANHEDDSAEVDKFVRRQLEESEMSNRACGTEDPAGTASGPAGESGKQVMRLCRLTQHRNKAGDITSSLAWDDLTGMKLDAGKVVEARSKEVTYLRDKRVYDRVLRHHAVKNKWKIMDPVD